MLTIGNLAMRQARAQYSCNFLACAGYEVVDNLGFPTVEAGVEAAMAAKADIVVLCSTVSRRNASNSLAARSKLSVATSFSQVS